MNVSLELRPVDQLEAEALVLLAWEEQAPRLELACDDWLAGLYATGEFRGKTAETALWHRPAGLKAKRLMVAGSGKESDFDTAALRKAAGTAARSLRAKSIREMTLVLPGRWQTVEAAAAAVEGALLGDYEPDQYKTEPNKTEKGFRSFTLAAPGATAALEAGVRTGRILAESQNFARELVNEPGNRMSPLVLADRAARMASEEGLECEVLDQARMQQLGMGALLGVAQGSPEPPALVVLRYRPAQAASATHLGLIGKGVTFDTGGVSIKPADGMEKMKYDMAGGAAVLGAMRAIARLHPPIPVTALIPAVENMVGGRAQRPGDIVTSLSGKTVEVLNTDAEGRLILIDAITYAQRLGCTHLVNAATLTGAIVVALGHVRVGAFTNNQPLLDRVLAAAAAQGEKMWPMPLDDEYKDYLKSAFADLPNIGGRWGGAITAAYFLKEFADPTPWVHLDIAGTAWLDEAKAHLAQGPSGVPVRTFVHLAMNWRD